MTRLRISFSGGGFIGAFHVGACEALLQAGAMSRVGHIAGASAGALVGAVLISETPLDVARAALSQLAASARQAGPLGMLTPGSSIVDDVRNHLCEHMPSDAHQRAAGKLHVALTSLRSVDLGSTHFKSEFASRDELIATVSASCDVPGVTGRLRATSTAPAAADATALQRWLRRTDIDGGLNNLFPDPWRGSEESDVVFVSPFAGAGFAVAPRHEEGTSAVPSWSPIAPSKHGRSVDLSRANVKRWSHAFFPPPDDVLRAYEREGFDLCLAWMAKNQNARL